MAVTYPEDRTGVLATNKITNEIHVITPENNRNFSLVIPKFAPFYESGFKIFKSINGTQQPLLFGIDFYFGYKYESASLSTTKNLWGCIVFMDLSMSGNISIEYQTLGGMWTLDEQAILEIVANEIYNPRGRTWDQVANKPAFGPTSHIQDASDFLTEPEVGEKLDGIAEAIAENADRPIPVPPVTLEDLGIPKIGNWGMASVDQAIAGEATDLLINPLTLKAVLASIGVLNTAADLQAFREHIANKNNPHNTDKEQMELGAVQNRGLAPEEKLLSNSDDDGLISLTQLRKYLRTFGCQVAPETEPVYAEKGALLSYRCTSNYDRIGLFADGFGHTYEKIIEPNSIECGYKPPQVNNYPPHGTVLQYYCLDTDRWKIVADGYGSSYHAFVEARSADCGYIGGETTTKPPAGTLLSAYCDGTVLVQTLANGSGGSYENRIPGHSQCANNTQFPPRGTLVSTYCENKNEIGKYTDGAGGYYVEVIVQNSTKCGYVPITTPTPVTNLPYGTPMGSTCQGTTYVNKFADGNGGTYTEIVEANSTRCGYIPTTSTTTTTRPPTAQPVLTINTTKSFILPTSSAYSITYSITNGQPNFTYQVRSFIRYSSGYQTTADVFTITTNSLGVGNKKIDIGIWGKDAGATFMPDDTYTRWAETQDDTYTEIKSSTIVITYSGFGTSATTGRKVEFSCTHSTITAGSLVYYTINISGFAPNSDLPFKIVAKYNGVVWGGSSIHSIRTFENTIRTDATGKGTFTITPTMQGTPGGVTANNQIMPDGPFKQWAVVDTVKSNEIDTRWSTGSTLPIEVLNTYTWAFDD